MFVEEPISMEMEIRRVMGSEVIRQSGLPIEAINPIYTEPVTIKNYRTLFPEIDDYYVAYLIIKRDLSTNEWDKKKLLNLEMLIASARQDFERAQEIKNDLVNLS